MTLPKTPSFRLDGKRALVAGASSGIGEACAVALAEAGADVVVSARRVDKLDALAAALTAAGYSASSLAMDVAEVEATTEQVAENGPFDILVNSAGLARHGPALDTKPDDFAAVSDLKAKGAYFLTRAVAEGLIAEGRPGSLINITSQLAQVGGIVARNTPSKALPKPLPSNGACTAFASTPSLRPLSAPRSPK